MSQESGGTAKVRETTRAVEAEMLRWIAYINDEVVPVVRQRSSAGLRAAAEQLGRAAEHLERASARGAGSGRRAPAPRASESAGQ